MVMESTVFATSKTRYTPLSSGDQSKYAGQSVRALPIRILTVGKKRSAGIQLIADDYIQKLKHYCPVEDVRIKSNPKNARDAAAQIEHEDMAVMGLIKSNEWVVMLDERGLNVGSEQMASLIADAGNTGASSILFCIGGPYGHGRQLRERADVSIRLSSLVLNHEIALVVLAEQLYSLDYSQRPEVPPLDIIPIIHHDLSGMEKSTIDAVKLVFQVIEDEEKSALDTVSDSSASGACWMALLLFRRLQFQSSIWVEVKRRKAGESETYGIYTILNPTAEGPLKSDKFFL